jgi:hypothetical protein
MRRLGLSEGQRSELASNRVGVAVGFAIRKAISNTVLWRCVNDKAGRYFYYRVTWYNIAQHGVARHSIVYFQSHYDTTGLGVSSCTYGAESA